MLNVRLPAARPGEKVLRPIGSNRRYAGQYAQLMDVRILARIATSGPLQSLTEAKLQLDKEPLTRDPNPKQCSRLGALWEPTPARVDAEACSWTANAVAIRHDRGEAAVQRMGIVTGRPTGHPVGRVWTAHFVPPATSVGCNHGCLDRDVAKLQRGLVEHRTSASGLGLRSAVVGDLLRRCLVVRAANQTAQRRLDPQSCCTDNDAICQVAQ